MAAPSNADIMHKLGSMEAELIHAKESRQRIHEKLEAQDVLLDETVQSLAKMNFTLQVTTDVAVQARDRISKFESEFHEQQLPLIKSAAQFKMEAEPLLRVMRIVRDVLVALSVLGVFSFAGFITAALYAREQLGMALRWILGL